MPKRIKEGVRSNILFWILVIGITIISLYRIRFGVEITDEAYHLAETKTVLKGNIPYVYNTSMAVGMTFFTIPFYWLYTLFVPGEEGVFLFMRFVFVAVKTLIVLLAAYFLLKKYKNRLAVSLATLMMMSYHYMSIPDFNYNTISLYLIYLVGCVLVRYENTCSSPEKNMLLFVAGICSALAVFAHPVASIEVIIFLMGIIAFSFSMRDLLLYIGGGLMQVTVVFVPILMQSGVAKLADGLLDTFYLNEDEIMMPTLGWVLRQLWYSYGIHCGIIFVGSALMFVAVFLKMKSRIILRHKEIISLCLLFSFAFPLLYFVRYALKGGSAVRAVGGTVGLVIGLYFILFHTKNPLTVFLVLPEFFFFLFEIFVVGTTSPASRSLFLYPAVVPFILYLGQFESVIDNARLKRICRLAISTFALLVTACSLISFYTYIYRDEPLRFLDTKVENGVYKGIYTTSGRAARIILYENYLRNNTSDEEFIAFRDNVPSGYLLANGQICDVRTWDCMQYAYHMNNPDKLYRLYVRRQEVPEKIFYVNYMEYGTNTILSIEDPDFLYNSFVNDNYEQTDEMKTDMLSIRMYCLKKTKKEALAWAVDALNKRG